MKKIFLKRDVDLSGRKLKAGETVEVNRYDAENFLAWGWATAAPTAKEAPLKT